MRITKRKEYKLSFLDVIRCIVSGFFILLAVIAFVEGGIAIIGGFLWLIVAFIVSPIMNYIPKFSGLPKLKQVLLKFLSSFLIAFLGLMFFGIQSNKNTKNKLPTNTENQIIMESIIEQSNESEFSEIVEDEYSVNEVISQISEQDSSLLQEESSVSEQIAVKSDSKIEDSKEFSENVSSELQIDIELDKLQKLFCELPSLKNRDLVNDYIKEHGFNVNWFGGYYYNASSCYIGLTSYAVSKRPRDREGAVIDVYFSNDGNIEKMGYTTGGSVGFFSDFKLTYENNKFHYNNETFDNGENAMQLYLVNTKINQ